jgi:hypothetical protein
MNIYEYNSSTINEYTQEDFGILSSSSWVVEDFGDLPEEINHSEDFYLVDCKETLVPFGRIKVSSNKTKYVKKVSLFERYIDLNNRSIVLHGIILRWVGFSIIFQVCSDLERKVIPDVSGGGQL